MLALDIVTFLDGELIQCSSLKSGGSNNVSLVSGGGEVLSSDDGFIDGNSDDVRVSVNSYDAVVDEHATSPGMAIDT